MTPYQSSRLVRVFHQRKWRMPTATLLREFGYPDLQDRKQPKRIWLYVTDPHIIIGDRPCSDWAFMMNVRRGQTKFDGSLQLSSCFCEKYYRKRIRWWRLLREWKSA